MLRRNLPNNIRFITWDKVLRQAEQLRAPEILINLPYAFSLDSPTSSDDKESLDEVLSRLLAERESIRPEDVTVEYISRPRALRFFPAPLYGVDFEPSEDDSCKLKFYSQEELEVLQRDIDAELAKL